MIIGAELRRWAADRQRQRAATLASRNALSDWRDGPAVRRFTDRLAAMRARDAASVVAASRCLLADHGWIDALLERLAAEMRADPFFDPAFRHVSSDIHSGLVLFDHELVMISLSVCRAADLAAKKNKAQGARSIGFTGQVSLMKFVKAGGASIGLWEAPEITKDFTAATAGQCRHVETRRMADGDMLVIDGRREGFVIEHARANLVLLQAMVKVDRAPLAVEYDAETRDYVGCSAADDSASRIQLITTLVRKLGGRDAFAAVASCLDHPDFFVRWHVMRELLGIDGAAALPHLKRMAAQDPHPETRRTARAVLDRIEGHDDTRTRAA